MSYHIRRQALAATALAIMCLSTACGGNSAPTATEHVVTKTETKTVTQSSASASTSETSRITLTEGDEPGETTFVRCDIHSGIGSDVTSCPFAREVGKQYRAAPGALVRANSPVTKQTYDMQCHSTGFAVRLHDAATVKNAVRCTGGNNAVVVLF